MSFDEIVETAREAAAAADVPGAALGVLGARKEELAAFGVTSVEHPLPVTPETYFQVGSITKTFTGTVAVALAAEGLLDLDEPVRAYIPELRLGDEAAAAGATMRHLLTHMGGWEGDFFDDPGRGDDALALMVARLTVLPQVVPLGTLWSYNNAGFYIAGRVLEVLARAPFERVVQDRLLGPLALEHSHFFPEDVMTYRFAVGHHTTETGTTVARPWPLARAANAAGGLISTVGDLLRWARFHLAGDPPWLASMREPQVEIRAGESMGLTWHLSEVQGLQLFGHDGGTLGQISRLLVAPEAGRALAVLTNSNRGGEVTAAAERAFLSQLGVERPEPVALALAPDALAAYAGRYVSRLFEVDVVAEEGRLMLHYVMKGGFPLPDSPPPPAPPPIPIALEAEDRCFVPEGPFRGERVDFLRENGAITWLRESRLLRREPR